MTRVALYARYSSDLQSAASVADQLRLCREQAERDGHFVVEAFSDHAISGRHLSNRPGLLALLEQARSGAFDLVLAEGLDRLSRDQADIATLYKTLSFHGVRLATSPKARSASCISASRGQ